MAALDHPLIFLGVRPNENVDPDDAFTVRSHVRKVVERQKRAQLKPDVFKFVQQRPGERRSRPVRKRTASASLSGTASKPEIFKIPENDHRQKSRTRSDPVEAGRIAARLQAGLSDHYPLVAPPVCTHPWALLASQYVDLESARLDALFKSFALREAAEAVFDPSPNSPSSMIAVFPQCLNDAAFFNALVYAVVLNANRGQQTLELLRMRTQAIQGLNQSITECTAGLAPVSIAAVLILRSAAYKWEGQEAHAVHANGLTQLLQMQSLQSMTPGLLRAIYWQDVFASVLFAEPPRQFTASLIPETLLCCFSDTSLASTLPAGFVRHSKLLPEELSYCILQTMELQHMARCCPNDLSVKDSKLNPMQAYIEARLCVMGKTCRAWGPLAAAIRIATFISAYAMFMDTWGSTFMPGRLSQQLLDILEASLLQPRQPGRCSDDDVWRSCRDLQLWLLMVVAYIAELDGGFFDDLRSRCRTLLRRFGEAVTASSWLDVDGQPFAVYNTSGHALLKSATEDFIFPNDCLQRCSRVAEWLSLVVTLEGI